MKCSQYEISQQKFLCFTLKCSKIQLTDILANTANYYREFKDKKKDKATGKLKKYKDGTVKIRTLRESLEPLKQIQRTIKDQVLSSIILPLNIHGGVKGKSNITNAKCHQGKKYKFCTDLQNFFPSITPKHVSECLKQNNFEPTWVYLLTRLMTFKHEVPQGTPTSTHIANLVFLKTDFLLIELCQKHNITYTRFVDDLTFSSDQDFRSHLQCLIDLIDSSGFKRSHRKTKYEGKQIITGIIPLNNYIDAPEKIKLKAKEESINDTLTKPYSRYLKSIRKQNNGVIKKTN